MTRQTKLFWTATLANIAWISFMRPRTPKNIIQFEFAKTVDRANDILFHWGAEGVALAKTSIYLDFIFITLYCGAIMLGCRVVSVFSGKEALIKIGSFLSWLIWIAGLCDVTENIAMLKTLQEVNQQTISIAFYFAAIKFGIVVSCLLFIITAAISGIAKSKKTT